LTEAGERVLRWLDQINWERLYKVLWLTAKATTSGARPTFDCGVSAEDLVGQALTEFWSSPKKLGWKPPKGERSCPSEIQRSLEAFLIVVLKRRGINHLRREKHVAGSLDGEHRNLLEPSGIDPSLVEVEYARTRERIYSLLEGEQDLKDLIAAAELTTGSYNVNQELGEILDKKPEEVKNLKRRLVNKPGIKELLYGKERAERKD